MLVWVDGIAASQGSNAGFFMVFSRHLSGYDYPLSVKLQLASDRLQQREHWLEQPLRYLTEVMAMTASNKLC